MPEYCYERPDGQRVTAFRAISNRNEPYQCDDGVIAKRCIQGESQYVAVGHVEAPYAGQHGGCEGLSVNPNQVGAMNDLFKRRGCKPAHFDKNGICHPDGDSHKRSMMEARGMVDNSPSGNGLRVPGDKVSQVVVDNV